MLRVKVVSSVLCLISGIGMAAWCGAGQDGQEGKGAEGKLVKEFIAAFNAGDASKVAGFFAPDAEYVDLQGQRTKGRDALEKLYRELFTARKGAKLTVDVKSSRSLTPDVVLEEGITEVTSGSGGPPTVAHFTAVLVKKEGNWLIQSVHDAVAHPPSQAEHFAGIDWLLGEWVGEETKGESATAAYSWAENRNFIVCSFATLHDGIPVVGGTQWIAWDAANKQIRSWTFYSGGGIGEAQWTKDGNAWKVKINATTAAGKKVAVTNLITKLDENRFELKPTQTTVDGNAITDLKPVKFKRVR